MINFLSTYLEPLSYALYLLVLAVQYRYDRAGRKAVLFVFYAVAALLMLYAQYLLRYPVDDRRSFNEWVYNLVYFLTGLFVLSYIRQILVHPQRRKAVLAMTGVVSMVFLFYYAGDLFSSQPLRFYSFAIASSFLSIVIACLFYFHHLLTDARERNMFMHLDFWLVTGFFLTYFGNFFIVLTYNYFSMVAGSKPPPEQRQLLRILWSAHNLLLFISALLTLILSLWIIYRKESRSPSLPRSFS